MGFIGVYRAIYDYSPQAAGELAIDDGDLLYIIEKGDSDGWWKAKKKAGVEDEDEPVGLIPHNYVETAPALGRARALYEYTRQTDEELSFHEDSILNVFDTSDPDWILVGLDNEFGFVPSNYIEVDEDGGNASQPIPSPAPPALPQRPSSISQEPQSPQRSPSSPVRSGPAAALAGVISGGGARARASPSPPPAQPARSDSQYDDYHHASDEDAHAPSPALPSRPQAQPDTSHSYRHDSPPQHSPTPDMSASRAPGGFHMYNVNEMVSVMGKRKKMPTTLGINLRTGMILIAPERTEDGPTQEWSADRMTHYSREGKHVFVELVRPSKSVDFHAGAKDTAEEIVSALGEMAGAVRAEGLREVIMAGSNKSVNKGVVLYDFMAQGEDEVTVAAGDEVIVVNDAKSEEWWQVRRLKSGKEGVVPSSYIEVTGVVSPPPGGSGIESIRATVEQNRAEELRLTKEALKASKEPSRVGPGMALPTRGSSLAAGEEPAEGSQRGRRDQGGAQSRSKSKPDASKVRTWTDRSKSFSVDAQFLGLKDGKIHLHKMNGVKIAVPIAKMSREDIDYVENKTGISLRDDKRQVDSKKSRSADRPSPDRAAPATENKKPEYDWFQFFLDCDVAVGLCDRYAQAFSKDSMDESVLPDVNESVLRTLGLREGDIIKVMRTLDAKFGRQRSKDGDGGLFSGPGGTLRNNTRKGRPAPAVQTSDIVDAAAFSSKEKPTNESPAAATAAQAVADESETHSPPPVSPTPKEAAKQASAGGGGFDDDAWDVKPSKPQEATRPPAQTLPPRPQATTSPPPGPTLTGSMAELSLLSEPLQPTKTGPTPAPQAVPAAPISSSPTGPLQQQPQGANPGFFASMAQAQQPVATAGPRQRPVPTQTSPLSGSLVPPPPQRSISAPQTAQPSAFAIPTLTPQMTGALQGQPAAPGQSLNDITQTRLYQLQQQQLQQEQQLQLQRQQQLQLQQQQQQQLQQQQQQPSFTGYPGGAPQNMLPFGQGAAAGINQFMQPMMTGMPTQSPFADPGRMSSYPLQMQPTGLQSHFGNQQPGIPQGTLNSFLPPALEPQRTAAPSPPAQQTLQPLIPQQTGPAPPVRFGLGSGPKPLAPQATGRKANLAQATPQNPFGF